MFYNVANPQSLAEYLRSRWTEALSETAKEVLGGRQADYIALRHLSSADRKDVLERLNVDFEKSAPLYEWGDHGTNDPLLSIDLGLKQGEIADGSLVAMVSGGIGFTYAAALIRWG
jgi:3-oxoacyl-[acyl-carrier-protein] synthase-3